MKKLDKKARNHIWKDKKHHYLTFCGKQGKQTWTMDYDERAAKHLTEHIRLYGIFGIKGHGKKGEIKKVVFQGYYPYRENDNQVKTKNGDTFDLSSGNLYVTGDIVPANLQRRIWHDGRRIWIKRSCADDLFFTEYDYLLYAILCDTRLQNWYVIQRGGTKRLYCHNLDGTTPLGFAEIIWLYHQGDLDPDHLIESIMAGKKKLSEDGLQIDHLRDNQNNNCFHNLAAMTTSENAQKNSMVTKINFPYLFIPIQKDGVYRIACGDAGMGYFKFVVCKNTSDFIDFLRFFYEQAKTSGKMFPNPLEADKTCCYSRSLEDDGREYHEKNYNIIEALLKMKECSFEHWPCDLSTIFFNKTLISGGNQDV